MNGLFVSRFFTPEWHLALAQLLLVVFSICVHEYCHARAALAAGDDTAAKNGHLTLNPLKQMGPWSLGMLALLGLAWGAVPVNPARMRGKHAAQLVALAGPGANLALFFLFELAAVLLLSLFPGNGFASETAMICYTGAGLNCVLFVLNLLPVPGLDGFQVVAPYLPIGKIAESEFAKGALLVVIVLLFFHLDYLFRGAQLVTWHVLKLLHMLVQAVF